jgi:tRNA threonylcarbamoyladenosine biosynthesis protein TsaE
MTYLIPNSHAMENLGGILARACQSRTILHLCGELGVGKTTLVRGFLLALGHTGIVKSPTYTLVEPYQFGGRMIYHFDFYRLGEPEELEYIGIRDYIFGDVICLIEWPEQGGQITPPADIKISISYYDAQERLLKLQAYSATGQAIITSLGKIEY